MESRRRIRIVMASSSSYTCDYCHQKRTDEGPLATIIDREYIYVCIPCFVQQEHQRHKKESKDCSECAKLWKQHHYTTVTEDKIGNSSS